jgi:hypothetical protein
MAKKKPLLFTHKEHLFQHTTPNYKTSKGGAPQKQANDLTEHKGCPSQESGSSIGGLSCPSKSLLVLQQVFSKNYFFGFVKWCSLVMLNLSRDL